MNVKMSLPTKKGKEYSFSITQETNPRVHPALVEVALFDMSDESNPRLIPCQEWCSEWINDDHYDYSVVRWLDGYDVMDLLGIARAYVYGLEPWSL